MAGPLLRLDALCDSPELVILRGSQPGQAGLPLILFASGGNDVRAEAKPEFLKAVSQLGRPVLFVIERSLSWYAGPGIADLIERHVRDEMARTGTDRVDTMGYSMGGFGAIAFAERLPVRRFLSIAPRYSPDPRIVPDGRAKAHLERLRGKFPFLRLDKGMARAQAGLVLYGTKGPDLPHMARLSVPRHVGLWFLPGVDHMVPHDLRRRQFMAPLTKAAFADDRAEAAAVLRQAGGLTKADLPLSFRLGLLKLKYLPKVDPGSIRPLPDGWTNRSVHPELPKKEPVP
jgi:pimeloyl-ACP methyl ester carboxylesterase